jgi:predicted MFS family arabinose efflux permease
MLLPKSFWIYSAGTAFIGAGFADFSLIAYHLGKTAVVTATWIPILYAATMVSAAVAAIGLGRAFDRIGISVMAPATIISATSAPLVFLSGPVAVIAGVLCWGVGMGAQESVMRAAIGSMAAVNHSGTAFGLFHMVFGIAWFAGSVLLGILYDYSISALAATSLILQLAGIPILIASKRLSTKGDGAATRGA